MNCLLVALVVSEMCLRLAKTKKNFELFEMPTSLGPGVQMFFRNKWRNLDTFHSYFIALMNLVALIIGVSFFQLGVRLLIEIFLYCTFTGTFANGFQNWFDHEWIDFGIFKWNMPHFIVVIFAQSKICKNCSIVFFFSRHHVFSIIRGVFWSVLQMCP